MRKSLILSALATLVVCDTALAGDFNYNYVQGSVLGTRVKSDGDSDNGKGFRVEGSVSNNQPMFLRVSFARNKYSSGSDNLRFTNASAGLGGHLALGTSMDVIGIISYESVKMTPHIAYSPRDTSAARSGMGLTAGLRGAVGPKFEWTASARYRDMQKIDPIIGFTIGANYLLTPALAVAVDASHEKFDKSTLDANESIVAVGVRYNFSWGK
jgi:predicted porin